jgi:hypothetical protein
VPNNRLTTIFALLAEREESNPHGGSLCKVAAEITHLSGAGIALASESSVLTSLCTSNDIAGALLDLEMTLQEGPCTDASAGTAIVEEQDLISPTNLRWLVYAPLATSAGARAVFGFPVRIGAVRLGVLSLYCSKQGRLTASQASDGYLMASVVGRAVLAMQAGAPAGALAAELEREVAFDFTIHQAAGMVSVQGAMSVGNALVSLRTHAFANSTPLLTLAKRVVAREVIFEPASGVWREVVGGPYT